MPRSICFVPLLALTLLTIAACPEPRETADRAIDKPNLTLVVWSRRHGNREVPTEWTDEGMDSPGEARIEIRKADKPRLWPLYRWFHLGEQHEIISDEIEVAVLHFVQSCDPERDLVVHLFREDDMEREVLGAAFRISHVARMSDREFELRLSEVIADVMYLY